MSLVVAGLPYPGIYPYHLDQLSLAIPPWVGAISPGDGFGRLREEMAHVKLRPYGALLISL